MIDPIERGSLLPDDLPNGMELVAAGRARAAKIPQVQLRYARERRVVSDREYKAQCRDSGEQTTYINLGYKTWAETRDVLRSIQARGVKLGFRLDRVSLIPDRRMGLPPELRPLALEETGIMMYTQQDWDLSLIHI